MMITLRMNYQIGDYVKYLGNGGTTPGLLQDRAYARIEEIQTKNSETKVSLFLLQTKKTICCNLSDIMPIPIDDIFMTNMGFQIQSIDSKKKYTWLSGLTISSCLIAIGNVKFYSGYRIGDFTKGGHNLDSFIENGEVNISKFSQVYPNVENINDLFAVFRSQNRQINEEQIILSHPL